MVCLVARAAPGAYTAEQILHEIPMAQVNALIHAGQVLDGFAMVWPDRRLHKRGRWLERVWRRLKRGMTNEE